MERGEMKNAMMNMDVQHECEDMNLTGNQPPAFISTPEYTNTCRTGPREDAGV